MATVCPWQAALLGTYTISRQAINGSYKSTLRVDSAGWFGSVEYVLKVSDEFFALNNKILLQ